MPNCISEFLNPPETKPTYLTLHDEEFPAFVSAIEVELESRTVARQSRAQVIPEGANPDANPPNDGIATGVFQDDAPPTCYFSKVPCRNDVDLSAANFKLVVWYQCDGTAWSQDNIVFTKLS